jgi:hypothetical protein
VHKNKTKIKRFYIQFQFLAPFCLRLNDQRAFWQKDLED